MPDIEKYTMTLGWVATSISITVAGSIILASPLN